MNWCIDDALLTRCRDCSEHGRMVVFDTETTGMSNEDEIVQIAAVEYVDGRQTRTLNLYLAPTCDVSPEAEEVHGLSRQFLKAHGIAPCEALARFFDFVGRDALIVGHNVPFDFRMLRNECEKFGREVDLESFAFCDTLRLAKRLLPGMPCYNLAMLISALKLDGKNSHDALDDTLACGALFMKLVQRIPTPGEYTYEPDLE